MQQPNAMATHTVGVAPPLSLAMEGLTPRHKSIENSLRAVLLVRRAAGAPVFHGSRACPPQVVDDISKGPMYAATLMLLMLLMLLRRGVPLTRGWCAPLLVVPCCVACGRLVYRYPASTTALPTADQSGYTDEFFVRLFVPKPSLCGEPLEVEIDGATFISYPVALPSGTSAEIRFFNVVFVLDLTIPSDTDDSHDDSTPAAVSGAGAGAGAAAGAGTGGGVNTAATAFGTPDWAPPLSNLFEGIAAKLAHALVHEEGRCGYVSHEVRTMLQLREEMFRSLGPSDKGLAGHDSTSATQSTRVSGAMLRVPSRCGVVWCGVVCDVMYGCGCHSHGPRVRCCGSEAQFTGARAARCVSRPDHQRRCPRPPELMGAAVHISRGCMGPAVRVQLSAVPHDAVAAEYGGDPGGASLRRVATACAVDSAGEPAAVVPRDPGACLAGVLRSAACGALTYHECVLTE